MYPLRTCLPHKTYFIFSRIVQKSNFLSDDKIKKLGIECMKKTMEKYNFELIYFHLQDNHFLLIIHTLEDAATISQIMQHFKANFAKVYNKLHNRIGPVWNERFSSKIIEDSFNPKEYFLSLLWYITYNSVRRKKTKNPRDYYYDSIKYYTIENYIGELKISLSKYFTDLGNSFQERLKQFLIYEKKYENKLKELNLFNDEALLNFA
jgi:REP element-mobilizing transposase RayT